MRVRIDSIQLIGTSRDVTLGRGLNIITGPIASGKTTLTRLCHALFGTGLEDFPPEVRENVAAIAGRIILGEEEFSIVRPFSSSKTAKIDISGLGSALRLPALAIDASASYTYGQWLLRILGLPDLRVPSAPTRPDSDPTPLSINDFFLYCVLPQETIDNSVCGHRDPFKNIKRKYVFEVLYGIYDTEVFRVQERLHEVNTELSLLASQASSFQRVLAGTQWDNRASLLDQLDRARKELVVLENRAVNDKLRIPAGMDVQLLRAQVLRLDEEMASTRIAIEKSEASLEQLTRLVKQLEVQSKRLTKTIIAKTYLTDFEFILCPRCGASVDDERGSVEVCNLCLQHPAPSLDRKDFITEQDRITAQIEETEELLETHKHTVVRLERQFSDKGKERERLAHELNFKMETYLSDSASAIADAASERPTVVALIRRLEDYLSLFEKLDRLSEDRARAERKKDELEGTLELLKTRQDVSEQRIRVLERNFETNLQKLGVPRFSDQPRSGIDRKTYLPIIDGRRFDDLSSQGLQVLVNVAYAVAHQMTALQLGLPLPNILVIDGLTTNVGQEGFDLDRVHYAYKYLISPAEELGDSLQIIVADGNVPPEAAPYVRLRLSEEDRLIPLPSGN